MSDVVTRIAPSPTGSLHVGTARSALFNYLFARKNNGTFLGRIEDTDRARSTKEFEDDVLEGLSWLGIKPDELNRQSERGELYKEYLKQLLDSGKAYLSKEESKINPGTQIEVVRLKNPGSSVSFEDMIRGTITFDTGELGDFVIARSIDDPLYHLAVVVDDHEMAVTHVIRGEDHISNTPRQILIQKALDIPQPYYAHIPLILAKDRSKLSKRHGATSVNEYRSLGYLPESIINYLALLGWNPDDNQELFSLKDLIQAFDIEEIHKGGAVFDIEKLKWFNREYLKRLSQSEQEEGIETFLSPKITESEGYDIVRLRRVTPLIIERISVFSDVKILSDEGELDYYFIRPTYKPESLLWKNEGTLNDVCSHLKHLSTILNALSEKEFTQQDIKSAVWGYAEEKGRGTVLWPMRYALSGRDKSPDPFALASVLEKNETSARLEYAIKLTQ